jgi:hypothetical protein
MGKVPKHLACQVRLQEKWLAWHRDIVHDNKLIGFMDEDKAFESPEPARGMRLGIRQLLSDQASAVSYPVRDREDCPRAEATRIIPGQDGLGLGELY